jgi:hypothetical protein
LDDWVGLSEALLTSSLEQATRQTNATESKNPYLFFILFPLMSRNIIFFKKMHHACNMVQKPFLIFFRTESPGIAFLSPFDRLCADILY